MIGTSYKMKNLDLFNRFILNNIPLEDVRTFNYLGIIFDCNMTLSPLFSKVTKTVTNKIYNLTKIRNFVDVKCAILIYKQTILPLLGWLLIICRNYKMTL